MLLKELVLTSLEALGDFEVNGKTLNDDLFGELADKEVKSFYVDTKDGIPFIAVTLEEY
jgi:hypothetical protein